MFLRHFIPVQHWKGHKTILIDFIKRSHVYEKNIPESFLKHFNFSNEAYDYFDCKVNDIIPWNMNLKTENPEKYE